MLKGNPKLKIIFLAGFLLSLHLALTAYVNSSFLASFFSEKSVGLLFTMGSLASIAALLLVPRVLPHVGGYKFILLSVGLSTISLFLLSKVQDARAIVFIFIIYFALNNIIVFLLDEFLESFSKNTATGRIRGFYLAFLSSAWVLAQIILSRSTLGLSLPNLYSTAGFISIALFMVTLVYFKKFGDPNYDKVPVAKSLRVFFKNKNLARIYTINFLLQFFYSWMVIYTPIYLHTHLNFSWSEIGTIFMVMLLPFVVLPFGLGKYSDKFGERKMLISGFVVAGLATSSLFFLEVHSIWMWALVLLATRMGASTIEVMSDVYFFKHVSAVNDEFVGIYRNTSSVAYIVGPLLATLALALLPAFNFIFLILGIIMLFGIYLASKIKFTDI